MSIISQIPKIANVVKNNVSTANNTEIPFLNIILVLMVSLNIVILRVIVNRITVKDC